ncbi:hypothetical protein [Burkholderia ubonensis]|uniref:hypothetical protein n=1 Tax=Burkholderia ubonensis TaxID=101571 RepID=UPI0012F84166|nr:hypothetical protein [Burkholderia ubonensis]
MSAAVAQLPDGAAAMHSLNAGMLIHREAQVHHDYLPEARAIPVFTALAVTIGSMWLTIGGVLKARRSLATHTATLLRGASVVLLMFSGTLFFFGTQPLAAKLNADVPQACMRSRIRSPHPPSDRAIGTRACRRPPREGTRRARRRCLRLSRTSQIF